MPEQLLTELTSSDFVALGIGTALLLVGRKLFWLALGGVGFLFGLSISNHLFHFSSGLLELGFALLCGIGCAFLAVFAQKIAVVLAGLVLGGGGALWLTSLIEPGALDGDLSPWLLVVALVGAIGGALIAPRIFEVSLAAATSIVGAALIVTRAGISSAYETWAFVGLVLVGLVVQRLGRRERVERRASRIRHSRARA